MQEEGCEGVLLLTEVGSEPRVATSSSPESPQVARSSVAKDSRSAMAYGPTRRCPSSLITSLRRSEVRRLRGPPPEPGALTIEQAKTQTKHKKREGKKARVVVEYIHTRDCLPGVDVRRASRFDDYTVYPKLRPYGSEGEVREQKESMRERCKCKRQSVEEGPRCKYKKMRVQYAC